MKITKTILQGVAFLMLTGCSTPIGDLGDTLTQDGAISDLLSYTFVIPNSQVNSSLSKGFPFVKRTGYGNIILQHAKLGTSTKSDEIIVDVASSLNLFNATKGLDVNAKMGSGLRYEPSDRMIYLKNVHPVDIQFGNMQLSKYVPQNVIDSIGGIIGQRLGEMPIYKMKDNITARFIKSIDVQDGNIAVKYGI